MENHIPLDRQFAPIPKSQEDAENNETFFAWGYAKPVNWDELDREFRCVILAEAGGGKTEEFRQHALGLAKEGMPAFFIRIEDIEADFYNAFEIGEEDQFQMWLKSSGEAWFFLDSVDEARLDNPRTFEKAIRRFAKGIAKGAHRAHIYISSRPYAWRPKEDRILLDELLYLPVSPKEKGGEQSQQDKPESALKIYAMRHLDKERIRRFCAARTTKDVSRLLYEVERTNLISLAERPFDLEGILAKWDEEGALGSRLDLLRHNIDRRLRDDHNTDRAQRQPLNLERAREGVRRLSAAVVLTGKAGINVPDIAPMKPGIDAEAILADWEPQDVRALLERGIFNDIIYGAVRFRHRDVRELLAAEWFDELLKSGNSRYSIESLFFREQYGEKIISPRLRSVLSWLILFDDQMRRKAINIHPEIAIEGGDPSRLPLSERKTILTDIVQRIAANETDHLPLDNSAIARIANPDLSEETLNLINQFSENDNVIFFLARLVWQGEMLSCVEPFIDIALDHRRGIYAKRVSSRAVMTCGSSLQKKELWLKLNRSASQIPQELLSEVIEKVEPHQYSVESFLISLGKLLPYERFKVNEIAPSLHAFIKRLPVIGDNLAITQLIEGVHAYLEKPPFVERRECHVSTEYAWLLKPAVHAVERLVEARNSVALGKTALSIMLMVPAVRYWHEDDFSKYKSDLETLVPSWPELNDALYWTTIAQARSAKPINSGEPLTDDRTVSWLGHFWNFDLTSIPRLLDYIRSRPLQDDRLVALNTAFRIYVQADKPAHILSSLQDAVADEPALQQGLALLLNPPNMEMILEYKERDAERRRKQQEEEEHRKHDRDTWIAALRANPDRVLNPPNLEPGVFTKDQSWLMGELQGQSSTVDLLKYARWQELIPNFGGEVAQAYRDAAVNHWRHYLPILQSEEAQSNSTPYSLIFGLVGLEIEATENSEFPHYLDENQVCHALRYITHEFNGFPSWFEQMYQSFPDLVIAAVNKELLWELENTTPDTPMHYILHTLAYYAPWLHAPTAPVILEWVEANATRINTNRDHCLRILTNSGIGMARLTQLVTLQIAQTNDETSLAWWYAFLVDCDPVNGIQHVESWLATLDDEVATQSAQIFITTLMGDRHAREGVSYHGYYRDAEHLKSLFVLMHRYIRIKEDINRANSGVYTPELRDNAQDARNRLFNLIAEIPGKGSYTIIKQLANEHPDPDYRPWMAKQSYKRAEEDGDLELWSTEQIRDFNASQIFTPATHRQLFDLAVNRLLDLKNWLELGNDSPWQTWQRADQETEMRNLIASWLNQKYRGRYTIAQEPELANSQRMDISLHNTSVHSPVPIELKLLDKGWSGPKLCERLRNQLVGDYLREESARYGVMLLVWRGREPNKSWMINNQRVRLDELADALKHYWRDIADQYPGVDSIDVIVIDLTKRGEVSE
jgi:hypothetical protein